MISQNRSRLVLGLVVALAVWAGCRDENPVGEDKNRAPETYLVDSPGFNEAGYYINHLYWDGFDRDGRVAYFEVTSTDSAGNLDGAVWHQTYRTDSLVRFPVGGETGTAQVLHNRFYVRAVDNLGRPDPDPAWVLFQAKDFQKPRAVFTRAYGFRSDFPDPTDPDTIPLTEPLICDAGVPPDTLPINATVEFAWTGQDGDSLFGTGDEHAEHLSRHVEAHA